ncbi:MAG: glycogen/starch/alpha-glucan phosphorylase, partial [Clostridia bacterium]|nr:glycogen/starch/alpha-glucan phosphorylase [Clostridia bacterium]
RLWSAEADKIDFEFHTFSRGEYAWAFHEKIRQEAVSQVLYPDDSSMDGKLLRLRQQYFFVSAGLQSILRRLKKTGKPVTGLPQYVAVHINDTHPALAVAELMRLLLDEENLSWKEAWSLTVRTLSYTNHTLLPEALEKWPVELFKGLLPRIYMIVEEINNRFCLDVLNNEPRFRERLREIAVISDGAVKMANLAIVGSHSVNGVAQLHTDIMKNRVMNNFHALYPRKFNNKTNGISQRRWLLIANPALSDLLTRTLGSGWIEDPTQLEKLAAFAQDADMQEKIARIKRQNKERLAAFIYERLDLRVDPESIFDIQIKRIHLYKRQLLNAFHIMALYNRLRENPDLDVTPRTFIFGGKAAPAYYLAKQVIKLINTLAQTINNDKKIRGKIKVVFMPNYNVSLAERLFPAADVSEQISTASKEASGTGNMKFVMNGAVTIGTLDGANVEIREKVGRDNFILFGLSAEEVLNYHEHGGYNAWEYYQKDSRIKTVCDQLNHGWYGHTAFPALCNHLLANNDEFFVLRDFDAYVEAQKELEKKFRDKSLWRSMCLRNIAYSGSFSSDRSIWEYAREIWGIQPVAHTLLKETKKR